MAELPPADLVLTRLRGAPLDALVAAAVDFVMGRPVAELLDPDWIAEQVVANLRVAAEEEQIEAWFRQQVHDLRTRVPTGRLSAHAPGEVVSPLREILSRPYLPDRDLTARLVNHAAMERIFKDVLVSALQNFAGRITKIASTVSAPKAVSRSFDRLRSIQRRAQQGVLGGISAEIDRQARAQISDHVDKSIHAVLSQVADHLCDPHYGELYGEFRAHLLDTLLQEEAATLAAEYDKLDPDHLVSVGAAVARTLARRPGLRDDIAAAARAALETAGGRSLQDFLDESGLETGWRAEMEQRAIEQARDFVDTAQFRDWLTDLLQPAGPEE
jgi:hypothetical protein